MSDRAFHTAPDRHRHPQRERLSRHQHRAPHAAARQRDRQLPQRGRQGLTEREAALAQADQRLTAIATGFHLQQRQPFMVGPAGGNFADGLTGGAADVVSQVAGSGRAQGQVGHVGGQPALEARRSDPLFEQVKHRATLGVGNFRTDSDLNSAVLAAR